MEFNKGLEELGTTWFLDLDGTIVEHNGYKNGGDKLLPNVKSFFNNLNEKDCVVITTARKEKYRKLTEDFLSNNGIRYSHIIFDLPSGSRVIINDKKPDGTNTAYSKNINRNFGLHF